MYMKKKRHRIKNKKLWKVPLSTPQEIKLPERGLVYLNKITKRKIAYKGFIKKCLTNLFLGYPKMSMIKKWKINVQDSVVGFMHTNYWRGKKVPFFKYTYLKRPYEYLIRPFTDTILQQHHYGFSSFASFKAYVNRFAQKGLSHRAFLGLEGMLANLLCRLTIFPEIRVAYAFIRSGAFLVNTKKITNPRKIIYVGDTISVERSFKKLILKYYLLWLKQDRILFGIPLYFDYDFKLMKFKVWRKITRAEANFIGYYPIKKNTITGGLVSTIEQKED